MDEDEEQLVDYDTDFTEEGDETSTYRGDVNIVAEEDMEINSIRESEKVIPAAQPKEQLMDEKIAKKAVTKTNVVSKQCSISKHNNTKATGSRHKNQRNRNQGNNNRYRHNNQRDYNQGNNNRSRHNNRHAYNQGNNNVQKSSFPPNRFRGHGRGHKTNFTHNQHQHHHHHRKRQESTNNYIPKKICWTPPSSSIKNSAQSLSRTADQNLEQKIPKKPRWIPPSSSIKNSAQSLSRTVNQNLEQKKRSFSEDVIKTNSILKKKKKQTQEQCGVKVPRFSTKILHHHPRIVFGDYLQGVCMNHIVAGDNNNEKEQKVKSKLRNYYRKSWTKPLRKSMLNKFKHTVHPASKETAMSCCNEAKFNIEKYEKQGFSTTRLIDNMIAFLFYLKHGIETVKLQQSCLDTLKIKYPQQNISMPETTTKAELSYLPSTTPAQPGIELQRLDDDTKDKPDDTTNNNDSIVDDNLNNTECSDYIERRNNNVGITPSYVLPSLDFKLTNSLKETDEYTSEMIITEPSILEDSSKAYSKILQMYLYPLGLCSSNQHVEISETIKQAIKKLVETYFPPDTDNSKYLKDINSIHEWYPELLKKYFIYDDASEDLSEKIFICSEYLTQNLPGYILYDLSFHYDRMCIDEDGQESQYQPLNKDDLQCSRCPVHIFYKHHHSSQKLSCRCSYDHDHDAKFTSTELLSHLTYEAFTSKCEKHLVVLLYLLKYHGIEYDIDSLIEDQKKGSIDWRNMVTMQQETSMVRNKKKLPIELWSNDAFEKEFLRVMIIPEYILG